jgi:hypothetical protein
MERVFRGDIEEAVEQAIGENAAAGGDATTGAGDGAAVMPMFEKGVGARGRPCGGRGQWREWVRRSQQGTLLWFVRSYLNRANAMTETEWLNSTNPDDLYLDRFASTPRPMRKLQLFACGCCRQIWEYITDTRCRAAVEVAELLADGLAGEAEFDAVFDAVEAACDEMIESYPESIEQGAAYAAQMALRAPSDAAYPVASVLALTSSACDHAELLNRNLAALADLFRDVFGNPYRPVAADPGWLSPTAVALARGIYTERAFDRLPILADALQDAGCENADMLSHCRGPNQVHVRGCWVVDLLLGRE